MTERVKAAIKMIRRELLNMEFSFQIVRLHAKSDSGILSRVRQGMNHFVGGIG